MRKTSFEHYCLNFSNIYQNENNILGSGFRPNTLNFRFLNGLNWDFHTLYQINPSDGILSVCFMGKERERNVRNEELLKII